MTLIRNSVTDVACRQNREKASLCGHWHKRSMMAMALSGAMLAMSPAKAGLPPDMSVFDQATEIPDSDLGHMRGKFVASGQIMYFGVEMVTQWQAANGEMIAASANLNVNLANNTPQVSFQPTITVEQNGVASNGAAHGTAVATGGGGLENVSGVVQSIQAAGTFNGVNNSIGMNVEILPGQGGGQLPSLPGGPLSASVTTPSGTMATVDLASTGMRVAVAVPDQGQAIQQIRSLGMGGGQVMQSVQLGGDLNQIHNMINLNVQMNALSSDLAARSANVLSGLKMLPQPGLF